MTPEVQQLQPEQREVARFIWDGLIQGTRTSQYQLMDAPEDIRKAIFEEMQVVINKDIFHDLDLQKNPFE